MKLEIEHLTAGYDTGIVLQDLSLSLRQGEFLSLLGPSGCGKTTLMKAVCGLLPVHHGKCLVNGVDCTKDNERQRALKMSYIPQRGSLITGKTVLEVVLMGFNARLHLLDSPGRIHREKAMEALERLGMAHLAQQDYATLSEGQKQIIILARTMVQDTPVMLMDEPDSALDFVNRNLVLGKIRKVLHTQNRAGLITLHDPNFALAYCDSLILMKQGRILQRIDLKTVTREQIQEGLSTIYGPIRILEYEHGYVMVRA